MLLVDFGGKKTVRAELEKENSAGELSGAVIDRLEGMGGKALEVTDLRAKNVKRKLFARIERLRNGIV